MRRKIRKDTRLIPYIGVDEKTFRKGHRCHAIVCGLDRATVEFVTEGPKTESLGLLQAAYRRAEGGALKGAAMGMWDRTSRRWPGVICSQKEFPMGSLALLQSLKESVTSQANVKTLYGEPISAHEKTIIPVAKIIFAYGAGAGSGGVGENSTKGEGGGGGGGVRAIPVGVIEVSTGQTRFVPITSRKKLVAASFGGIVVGALVGWLRRRR